MDAKIDITVANCTWWEKTVEYAFITRYLFDAATPLSGIQERVGDAFFQEGTKFLLIEFKRDADALSSEFAKYTNYDDAKKALSGADGHHLLVFGTKAIETTNGFSLQLAARTYFGGKFLTSLETDEIGVEKDQFDAYIERLVEFKKDDGRSGGGDFMAGMKTVVGVAMGKEPVTTSLDEYRARVLKHDLTNTMKISMNSAKYPSGPGF